MTIGEREYERHRQATPNGKLAESYFDLAGVRGPVCEVIDAMAEDNDRLRRELEEAREELRVQKLEYQQKEATLRASLGMLNRQKAELDRMRPVVEAAKDFCHEHYPGCSWDCPHPSPQCRFNRAVVAYFGQDAVYPPPEEDE